MKHRKSSLEKVFDVSNYAFIILLCILTIYPFWHTVSIAFSSKAEGIRPGLHLWPLEIDFASFVKVITANEIWTSYYNTIHRTVIGASLSVLITGMGAYVLAKKDLPLRRIIMIAIVFTMYFDGGMISRYILIKTIGLYDSRWSQILPLLVFGFNLIIMRNFFANIPSSLEDSAKIDGASDFTVFFKIIIPLSTPILATIVLFMAVHHWNSYLDNLLYIQSSNKYVLQRMIRSLLINNNQLSMESLDDAASTSSEALKASTVLIATVPIILVYPFAQKYFVKGIMIGAVKG